MAIYHETTSLIFYHVGYRGVYGMRMCYKNFILLVAILKNLIKTIIVKLLLIYVSDSVCVYACMYACMHVAYACVAADYRINVHWATDHSKHTRV